MEDSALVRFLLEHNKEQSKEYCNPDTVLWRRQYRAKHPTEIAALKCMDGRLHLPVMTNVPLGVIQPFRNIGGRFDLGWPFFGVVLKDWVEEAVDRGHDAVILVTYHFSQGDKHRGCKGYGYDIDASREGAFALRDQIERVFGVEHLIVYPIVIGIETDEDALIFHGAGGKTIEMARLTSVDEDLLRAQIHSLYPDMKTQIVLDLLPLAIGNYAHIAEVRSSGRKPVDSVHKEQILGVGRGFDWLHLHNKALLVGPFSYDLGDSIANAAGILLDNIQSGRISKDEGVVLLASAAYQDEVGTDPRLAEEKAKSLAKFSLAIIQEKVPELLPHLSTLVGILDMNTRKFSRVNFVESRTAF